VSVNGTNIETNVDGTGHFTLDGVPSGTIVLKFTGRGVDASVTLRGVSEGDQIQIDVRLEGAGSARVESENRHRESGGEGERNNNNNDNNNQGRNLPDGVIKIEGDVANLSGACPALTFRVGSQLVRTTSSTFFEHIKCAEIKNGVEVEVFGRMQADGSLMATAVEEEYY
jgi:hypothetical protein